ncbi:MAG: DUF6883 domain-containing protein [Christensenellales bacterium]
MDVFENIRDKVLSLFNPNSWVKWIHDGIMPAYTHEDRGANIDYASKSNHCAKCLNMNDCFFPKNNMPDYPLHYGCHCRIEPVTNITFNAECSIEKFQNYIFDSVKNNGKKALFEKYGYSIKDSQWLQEELCRQAQEKYAKGDFVLNKLDDYGQRINIEITLPNKNGNGSIVFMSGWMVCPNGTITNATPCRGEINERV